MKRSVAGLPRTQSERIMRFVSLIILALGIAVLVASCSKVYSPAGLSAQDSARDEMNVKRK